MATQKLTHRSTAISIVASKDASLYFDSVIPFCTFSEAIRDRPEGMTINDVLDKHKGIVLPFVEQLVPAHLRDSKDFASCWADVDMAMLLLFAKPIIDKYDLLHICREHVTEGEYQDLCGTLRQRYSSLADRFNLHGLPVITPSGIIGPDVGGDDFLITLRGLNLIDARKATWEHIAEFRADPTSTSQLRRLRLFAADKYDGRDKAFIEDDLLSRIDAYHEQVRRWGFETAHAALGMLLSSRIAATALGGALVSTLVGAPSVGAATAAGGILIECGKIVVEVSRRRTELRNALADSPVSYIVRAQSEIG